MAVLNKLDTPAAHPCKLLLIEDNAGDVRLVQEALKEIDLPVDFSLARDGQMALDMLISTGSAGLSELPDIILLDLNLPKRSGQEVLTALKTNPKTQGIPVVIFSTSGSIQDIFDSYQNHANCYVCKPTDLDDYLHVTREVFEFWLTQAVIPGKKVNS
jgi:CheY-like chemotaxis protein